MLHIINLEVEHIRFVRSLPSGTALTSINAWTC